MIKKLGTVIIVFLGLSATTIAISQTVKLNPIKPIGNQALTDEQQAVLAVRKAKASVVNIAGERTLLKVNDEITALDPISGTGIVWSADGLVVTNSHVISEQGVNYRVILGDGSTYPAKILGFDPYADVGILKIEATGLIPATFGNSDNLETGQSVFAIGNSLGRYQNSVTRGVVSGVGRAVNMGSEQDPRPRFLNLIQTDAAINPGNSGGPLVNMAGEVIGINTLRETGQSLGFALPINAVKLAVDQLKTLGKVSHPYLGLTYETITPASKILRKLQINNGAFIIKVADNSPAQRAGLKAGDIVTAINKDKLSEFKELDMAISNYQTGNTVLVTYTRNGKEDQTPVLLGEYK